jgi:hypothetical protein
VQGAEVGEPAHVEHHASPSITKRFSRNPSAVSMMNGYRLDQSWPPLVSSRTRSPFR